MDALLPSEIARLVLGYLQEQKCEEAAKMFMETSPHLQECRLVSKRGGRYSTKVGGLSLVDMLDKYCAANSMVQEKLNKVSDSEQIKNCNDITEQLRYLLEGSRGHRFVVNINVPQNSPNGSFGSSPIVSTSSRKRHHSVSDRGKRGVVKSLNNLLDKDCQTTLTTELNCDAVAATPLESLPGHTPSAKKLRTEINTNNLSNKSPCKYDSTLNVTKQIRSSMLSSVGTQSDFDVLHNSHKNQSTDIIQTNNLTQTKSQCTEGTTTGQSMSYCSTEVQTAPLDLFDIEHDMNYEPIANLSLLTEELIQRTELAEQIAENINKSIIPIQTSLREENAHENPEANLSLFKDFDNAVKSAVETTDKVLEGLFNEIFTVSENDTSPDEDSNGKNNQELNNAANNKNYEAMDIDNDIGFMLSNSGQRVKGPEIPLKQRLRSSSRTLNNPDEDEQDTNVLLENQNEEAIMSIVANVMASKKISSIENDSLQAVTYDSHSNDAQQPEHVVAQQTSSTDNENVEPNKNANNTKLTKPRKNSRKQKIPKPKSELLLAEEAQKVQLQEQNMATMPTLIICSRNEVDSHPAPRPEGYIPIAPKPLVVPKPSAEPEIFLRTVNVPRHLVKTSQLETTVTANQLIKKLQASPQKSIAVPTTSSGSPIVLPLIITDEKQLRAGVGGVAESITLYGDDSNSEVQVAGPIASMPVIGMDESACNLTAGTGLSPFFKGNVNTEMTKQDQPKIDIAKEPVNREDVTQTRDDDQESKQQIQTQDKVEKDVDKDEVQKISQVVDSNKTNPTIIITSPDEEQTIPTGKEKNVPEKASVEGNENKTENESASANETSSAGEIKETKVADEEVLKKIEDKVNEKLIPVKEDKVDAKLIPVKEDKKVEEQKDGKTESKSISVKGDIEPEGKSIPEKKNSIAKEKIVPEKVTVVKKSSKVDENTKANESRIKTNSIAADAIITKRTPKSLLKDRLKNNRLSLSTPRRRNSHVRALDFDEKTPDNTIKRKMPQSCKPKSSAVQGLFLSPPFSGETHPVPLAECKPVKTHVLVPPIATRSPAPKLQGNWNKVAGIGTILVECESPPEKSQLPQNLSTIVEEKEPPKSWDSDLRKIVGEVNEDEDKQRPKSAKKIRNRSSIKSKTTEEVTQPKKSAGSAKKKTSTKSGFPENVKITTPPTTLKPKTNVQMKTSPELLARVWELETPCKMDINGIPPTPRVVFATPGACFVKIGSGNEISINDGVNTPDFPVTPCIVFTPKIVEEEDHEKKPSPYYEPSDDPVYKEVFNSGKLAVQKTTAVTIQKKNVVELEESKTIKITKFGVIEENMAQKDTKEIESTSEDTSKENIEDESMGETNASADTTNTDSDSDSNSDSDSSTSSSSSNSSSSNSSSCSSNASSPTKSIIASPHDNSTTESEVDSPPKVPTDFLPISNTEVVHVAENSPEKDIPAPKVITPKETPALTQLTSTISSIITNEKPVNKPPAKPKIINVQRISPPVEIQEPLTSAAMLSKELEEKRQRVMAKFKETVKSKRPITVKRAYTVRKIEATQNVKKIVKQETVKKIKPSPKKKVAVVKNEDTKPKTLPDVAKENSKTKIDQVKRDLFAPGDEAEHRKTRSQSARKSIDENPPPPCVLESLQLIPANKDADDSLNHSSNDIFSNSQTNTLEVSIQYDDSVPIKKRKINYGNSQLETEYAYSFPDEEEVRLLKVSPYKEIFNMGPKMAKKKSPKKSPIKVRRKVSGAPLAQSSPLKKNKLQKNKACKRKPSPVKEEKPTEKKVKAEERKSLDPQTLFKKIDVDKFLRAVHVSK